MALRDNWHRALHYFGLYDYGDVEEVDDDPREIRAARVERSSRSDWSESVGAVAASSRGREDQEEELEGRYRERPNVRRLSTRRRRDDFDDIFADDPPSERRTTVLRPVDPPSARGNGRNGHGAEGGRMHVVVPSTFNDAQEIADRFKERIPVILNLQGTETDLAKRLIDFVSGLTYALDGGMQRIADKVFLVTPANVEVSAEERAAMLEGGFFNQS